MSRPAISNVQIKRVYELRSADDGQRILVDRVWPRGVSKATLQDAIWLKEIAPSAQLRKWFDHRAERWRQFCTRYAAELDRNPEAVAKLRALRARGRVTLLYSARDVEHNQARALAEYLQAGRPVCQGGRMARYLPLRKTWSASRLQLSYSAV